MTKTESVLENKLQHLSVDLCPLSLMQGSLNTFRKADVHMVAVLDENICTGVYKVLKSGTTFPYVQVF